MTTRKKEEANNRLRINHKKDDFTQHKLKKCTLFSQLEKLK